MCGQVLFNLAFVQCKLKKFNEALDNINKFLAVDIEHRQGTALKNYILKKQKEMQIKGAALVGGGAGLLAMGVGILAAFIASLNRKK